MDCQTSVPLIWATEVLASSDQTDVSLLLDLLEKAPDISCDIGRNARELVSMKILENLFTPLSEIIRLDPSDPCEDVLQRILSEVSPQHLKSKVSKWDLEPFIEHKRSNMPKCALKQLKDAILTGSQSISASLKEQSGLLAERETPVKHEGSTKRSAQCLDKENQDGKSIRKMFKSTRVEGRRQAAELKDFNFRDETTFTQVSEISGSENHAGVRSKKGLLSPLETDLPCIKNSSPSAQSPPNVQEQVKKNLQPPNLKMRRKSIPWTSEEEDKLKERLRLFSVPNNTSIPWTHILQHGQNVFHPSRTGVDLRDKWRNMSKARPNAK